MIDAHCHLNDSQFDGEVEHIIANAKSVGVRGFICNGSDLETSIKCLNIAKNHDEVFATAGIHPEVLANTSLSPTLEKELLTLAQDPKVVAIGESGLDNPHPAQIELFEFNIQLAKKTNLPLVVHCRNAFEEVYSAIKNSQVTVQMHCFTGSWDWAKKFLDLGCYLSFGGIVTFKSSQQLRDVVTQVPPDRLVIETDSPYISPEPLRGQRNTPANLPIIGKLIAQLRGIDLMELDQLTSANASSLFPRLILPNL